MKKSIVYILSAASMWGTISIFIRKLSSGGFSPVQIVFARCFLTALMFIAFFAVINPGLFKIRIKDIPLFIGTGIISVVCFNSFYFTTIMLTSASTAAVLLYTSPVFVTIMGAMFFKERISFKKAVALVIVMAGCWFVCNPETGAINIKGATFGIAAGFLYSLYSIFGKFAINKYKPETVTIYTFVFASLGALPFSDVGSLCVNVSKSPTLLLWALGAAVITTFLPYLLYTKGLANVEAGTAAVVSFVEPVVATVTGFVVFHELIDFVVILGIVLVMLGIVILNVPDYELFAKKG